MRFTIRFNKRRYTSSYGATKFGETIIVETGDREQAEAICDALSIMYDAGLSNQFYIDDNGRQSDEA
jgi:hypothetical protein